MLFSKRWPKISLAYEHLLIPVGSETGLRLWCQCWVAQPVPAAVCRAIWLGSIRPHSIKFCWSQGRREQSQWTHMCALSLQLCRNRTQSPTLVQWLPKRLSEPRHLEHSHTASRPPSMLASVTSACENSTQLNMVLAYHFVINLYSQARENFRNSWRTREEVPWGWVHMKGV